MSADRGEIGDQLLDLLEPVDFPVSGRAELERSLGAVSPYRRVESGDFSMTLVDLDRALDDSDAISFPYEDVRSLVEDVLDGLEADGHL